MPNIYQGDLYWLRPEGNSGSIPEYFHPHVVIQENVLNHSRIHSVVVCALTTNLKRAREPGNLLLDPEEGNLPRPSAVIVSQISAVNKSSLEERIGALSPERIRQILAGLRFQQASFFRRDSPPSR